MTPPDPDAPLAEAAVAGLWCVAYPAAPSVERAVDVMAYRYRAVGGAVELGACLYAARLRRGALLSVIGDVHPRVRRAVETWARAIAPREGG